jgi:hypothetical protein
VLYSRVGSWPHPQTLDEAGKACQGQNTLPYYVNSSITAVKGFVGLVPVICLKYFLDRPRVVRKRQKSNIEIDLCPTFVIYFLRVKHKHLLNVTASGPMQQNFFLRRISSFLKFALARLFVMKRYVFNATKLFSS